MSSTSQQESHGSHHHKVKFLVGPKKTPIHIDKNKLSRILHSLDQFGSHCELDIPEESFRGFVNMTEDKPIDISSTKMAIDLLVLAEKLVCLRLNSECVDYLKAKYKKPDAYEYAKTMGLQIIRLVGKMCTFCGCCR